MPGGKVELKRSLSDEEEEYLRTLLSGLSTDRQQLIGEIIKQSQIINTPKLIATSIHELFEIPNEPKSRRNLESLTRTVIKDLNEGKRVHEIVLSRGKGALIKNPKSLVKLERTLSNKECDDIDELVNSNDLSSRTVLIATILKNALNEVENLQSAQEIVDKFSFSASKDAVGTTRALITRVLKDINSGQTVSSVLRKRGAGDLELQRWSDERIINRLVQHHHSLENDFSYKKLKEIDSSLISALESKSSFQNWLEKAGINPLVHLQDLDWGNDKHAKALLTSLLNDIKRRCGIQSLNVLSMDSYQNSILGIDDLAHIEFEECNKYGCIRRVSGAAIVRKMTQIFGSYKDGVQELLGLSIDDYEQLIERKRHEIDLTDYLERLRAFIANDPNWLISDFASKHRPIHHGLHNKREKLEFFRECYEDVMASAVAEIEFLDSELSREEFAEHRVPDIYKDVLSRRTTNPQSRLEGYNFQKLFLEMLTSDEVGLVRGTDFLYEKEIDRADCSRFGHEKICKPDFRFPNLIIDTKRTVTAGHRIADQTKRYLDHTSHLVHVTLNQRYTVQTLGDKKQTRLTIFEFIDRSPDFIGRGIPSDWHEIFRSYAVEAARRINPESDTPSEQE